METNPCGLWLNIAPIFLPRGQDKVMMPVHLTSRTRIKCSSNWRYSEFRKITTQIGKDEYSWSTCQWIIVLCFGLLGTQFRKWHSQTWCLKWAVLHMKDLGTANKAHSYDLIMILRELYIIKLWWYDS
jgi:hypothetical protein